MKIKNKKKKKVLLFIWIILAVAILIPVIYYLVCNTKYARMTFIGHATVKIITTKGTVIYIDPYFPVGNYLEPADYILITHGHSDHNDISKCKQAPGCQIIKWSDALVDGEYQVFEKDDVRIEGVPSGGNYSHDVRNNVGYLVTVDGVTVYHGGDTSMFDELLVLADRDIDYALYTVNGVYTMGPKEASVLSDKIGATYNIPIHGDGKKYSEQRKQFSGKGKLALHCGQMIFLKKHR